MFNIMPVYVDVEPLVKPPVTMYLCESTIANNYRVILLLLCIHICYVNYRNVADILKVKSLLILVRLGVIAPSLLNHYKAFIYIYIYI